MRSLTIVGLLLLSLSTGGQYQGYWVIFNFRKVIPFYKTFKETQLSSHLQHYPAPAPRCPFMIQAFMPTYGFSDSFFSLEQHQGYHSDNLSVKPRIVWYRPQQRPSLPWSWPRPPPPRTEGCRGCGPGCVAHCSCPEMAAVRWASVNIHMPIHYLF